MTHDSARPGAPLPVTPPFEALSAITHVRPWGGQPVTLHLADGVISAITPMTAADPPAASQRPASQHPASEGRTLDGRDLLALPGIVNAHAHVDKSWWGLPWQSYGGEGGTQGRIAHERARRDELGIPGLDITTRVLAEMVRHGTTAFRSHVDVDLGLGLSGLDIVRDAAARFESAIELHTVAFPQDGILRRDGVADLLRRAAHTGRTEHIGGLDPASIDRDPVGQIDLICDIAADTGVGIDIHLHDPAELGAFQIELLCERAERYGLIGRITIAHGFALAQLDSGRRTELLARMGEAGMSMTTVAPLRLPQLPKDELRAAGVRLALGTDGIRDLWSPYGTGDTLGIAWQFARASSLVTDDDLLDVVRLATTDAAWALGRPLPDDMGFGPGCRADIVLIDAMNPLDALVRTLPREAVIGAGRLLYSRT